MEEQVRELKSVARDGAAPVKPVINLAQALRRARTDDAARADVVSELRGAELARLEALEDALQPVLEQLPKHVDLFDVGLMPGEKPRLFIDMIGFVEMGRDRRAYRFLQDTRHGRITLAESDRIETIVEAATSYIARRLVEREKALAADLTVEQAARALLSGAPVDPTAPVAAAPQQTAAGADAIAPQPASQPVQTVYVQTAQPAPIFGQPGYAPAGYVPMALAQAPLMAPNRVAALRASVRPAQPASPPPAWRPSAAFSSFLFIIEVLGAATFFALIGLGIWGIWQAVGGWAQDAVEKL